jgi:hypothetical protein
MRVTALVGAVFATACAGRGMARPPGPAAASQACEPLAVTVEAAPTAVSLSWQPRSRAHHYFLQYSVGKFPTQETVARDPDGQRVTARLEGFVPGSSYAIEVCEAHDATACPSTPGRSCTTMVAVTTPFSYPGQASADPSRAACTVGIDIEAQGEPPGYPLDEPRSAATADECCQLCARALPRRPYHGQCLYFVFDEQARQCLFLKNQTGRSARAGRTSGRVVSWPRRVRPDSER